MHSIRPTFLAVLMLVAGYPRIAASDDGRSSEWIERDLKVLFGWIDSVHPVERMLEIDGEMYRIPANVDGLNSLRVGDPVAVYLAATGDVVRIVRTEEPR